MNRPSSYVIQLGAAALLVGAVALGCAGHDRGAANGPTGSNPAATAPGTQAAETLAPVPAPTPADATPTSAEPATSTSAPGATADPLDATLSNLDQLLNGVDGSLSGSDASASGGE